MKTDEIVVGKWYVIHEAKEHARQRVRASGHYFYGYGYNFDPDRWGKCVGDGGKGHKLFEVLQSKTDKLEYAIKTEKHTCRSVIEEMDCPVPVEGTEAYQEWKDRLFKIASEEIREEQRQERVQNAVQLIAAIYPDSHPSCGYRAQNISFSGDFEWLLDLIETNIFNTETMDFNDMREM